MADNQKPSVADTRSTVASRPRLVPKSSTIRVTEQGLGNFLGDTPAPFAPGPDTYIFCGTGGHHHPHGDHGHGANGDDIDTENSMSTNGDHVGRDLSNKQGPVTPIDEAGPNPYGDRRFYADEFQGMLTFDGKGVPTFYSRFPEAQSVEDITELRINIATRIPDYMRGDTPQAKDLEAMENDAFGGHPFKDVFAPVDKTMQEQVERYAKEFEAAYGIKMTVGFDLPDAHLSLVGYTKGDPNLLGFASFPPGINDWPELEGLGAHPGYLVMNNQYTATATEKEVYDLFTHEFGHTLGLAHPHDLALLNMSKREALTATKMAYTDLKLRSFQHVVTDADGNPVLDENGKKQYVSEGPDVGVLDMGLRNWVANAPEMGVVKNPDPNSPDYDGYKGVYDLAAHTELAVDENATSLVYRRERLLPMVPMINNGKNTVLKGTEGNDYIDTNPGYATEVQAPGGRARQQFVLVEGHIEKIMGITGNNIIVPSQKGDQEILPGNGNNAIRMLYPDMQGHKTIISEGKDTLILTEELLEAQKLTAQQGEQGIVLTSKEASITLGGKGIENIRVVNSLGRPVAEFEVKGLDAQALNQTIFNDGVWKSQGTSADIEHAAPAQPSSWQERIAQAAPARTAGRAL